MLDWFEELFKDIIWKALNDFFNNLASKAETEIESYLDGLTAGQAISSSPLVKVLAVDATNSTITFLVRGRVKLFKGVESAFMRVEVEVSKDVDLSKFPPITVVDWHTVIGDLTLSKKNVFDARVALGYDNGTWLGRGALKIIPAGFGLDIFVGGINERGAMIGLDADFPTPIPLGTTGLGLSGVGGDFAYNFIPRLESGGVPITEPTAKDYVTWARNPEVDRWVPGPIDETAVGVGIRSDLVTLADSGRIAKLEPIGLAVLTPGPVFLLGGTGRLLDTNSAKVEGYLAVDIPSASLALGLGVHVKIPEKGGVALLDGKGLLDAFFSFADPSLWYINFGTDKKPISAEVLNGLLGAEIFFMINNSRMHFGAGIFKGFKVEWWIIKLFARIGARAAALVGWNPVELAGWFKIWAELGFSIWKFKFLLNAAAEAIGHTPQPTQLEFEFSYKLDLPWPIPDIKGKKAFSFSDEQPVGPPLVSPLMVGTANSGGVETKGSLQLGAIHAITGRQWELGKIEAWPDIEIVVPFNRRVIDNTSVVMGPAVSPEIQGGYEVKHQLNKVELFDMVHNAVVPNVRGVWAAGPGGDTARLHLLAQDPFSWLTAHKDVLPIEACYLTPPPVVEQLFGPGPPETFMDERRFKEMLVKPSAKAKLIDVFQPALPMRVMSCDRFRLRFRTFQDLPVNIDQLVLFLVTSERQKVSLIASVGDDPSLAEVKSLYGELRLVAATIPLTAPIDEITIQSATRTPLLVYAVRYREARKHLAGWLERTTLVPGKYRVIVEGKSTATHPQLPDSTPVDWRVEKIFGVKFPETLRPYIHYTTLGDSRIFFDEPHPWNPTMYGFGFPVYKQYRGLIRFLVPYMKQIFSPIKMRLEYEKGPTLSDLIKPKPNEDGESSSLHESQDWVTSAGGATNPDEEIVFTKAFPQYGAARLFLLFDNPSGTEVKLDEWSCYVSQFDMFNQHLSWDQHCLQTYYDAAGRRTMDPPCPTIEKGETGIHPISRWSGNRVDTAFKPSGPVIGAATGLPLKPLLADAYPVDEPEPYPDELTSPPLSWRLPTAMTNHLTNPKSNKTLDVDTGVRFARFAHETSARFNDGYGDKLDGIGDTVNETTIEAVVDLQGRPYALWLRTPEPVDWRRVSASLRIRHTEQIDDCPTGYAHRKPLDMEVTILPSPDATSAFLVGSFAGIPTRLPRGEFELTLSFDPHLADLPKLRLTPVVGSPPELVKMKFLQPFGLDWPLPPNDICVPGRFRVALLEAYHIDPRIMLQVYEGLIQPEELMRLHREGAQVSQPIQVKTTPKTSEEERALHQHLVGMRNALTGVQEIRRPDTESRYSRINRSTMEKVTEEERTPDKSEKEVTEPANEKGEES